MADARLHRHNPLVSLNCVYRLSVSVEKRKRGKNIWNQNVFHAIKACELCKACSFLGCVILQHVESVVTDGDLMRKFRIIEKSCNFPLMPHGRFDF